VLGQAVGELDLDDRFGVAVTRITRADIEMSAVPGLRLQFGDTLLIVGREADLNQAAVFLGKLAQELNETHFIPLFIGIFLGVVIGTMPIVVPGLPQPVRLGLAAVRSLSRWCSAVSGASDGWCATCRSTRTLPSAISHRALLRRRRLDAGAKIFCPPSSVPPVSSGCWPARV